MRGLLQLRLALLLLSGLALSVTGAEGQLCPEGQISYIFIDNRSIFDTTELGPDARFLWAYRLANSLHMRTRESFLQKELLFETGDCLDPIRLAETERLLRSYPFIARADVFAVPQPDGSQHIVVDTQDEWTTRVDVGFRFDDKPQFTGIAVAEENLLGRGMRLRFFFQENREVRDVGVELATPRFLNTRWDARVGGGQTRSGVFFEETLLYPFVGEIGRVAARQNFVHRETLFSYAIPDDPVNTHLLVPFLDERWDLIFGGRLGNPGNLTVFAVGASHESIQFVGFPDDVELVQNRDYSLTVPADSLSLSEVSPQVRNRSANRINFFLAQRNLRFIQRRGLDALKGIQDLQVGTELYIGLGRGLDMKGKDGEEAQDDLHTQIGLFAGGAGAAWTLNVSGSAEGRQTYAKEGTEGSWKDIFAEGDAYLYWQPQEEGDHTLLFRLSAAGGWSVQTPFQLTLGGQEAIRGYREEAFPGGQRIVSTIEDRRYLSWPAPELFDFGLSSFMDLGHIWPGGVPFGVDSGWRASIGTGIRFGLPPGTGNMARIDLALPLGSRTQFKDLVLRVSLHEIFGILPGVRDRQLVRSLRNGVRPTIISLPW